MKAMGRKSMVVIYRQSEVIIFRVALGGDLAWSRRVNRRERRLQNWAGNFESRYSDKLITGRSLAELRHATFFIFFARTARAGIVPPYLWLFRPGLNSLMRAGCSRPFFQLHF